MIEYLYFYANRFEKDKKLIVIREIICFLSKSKLIQKQHRQTTVIPNHNNNQYDNNRRIIF